MILQSLCEYYQRRATDQQTALAPYGFEEKPIPFLIVINDNGQFIQLEDTRVFESKKAIPKSFLVPKGKARSGSKSYEIACCLWDHYGYVLNQPKVDKPGELPNGKDIEMAANQHQSFVYLVNQLAEMIPGDTGVKAVKLFLQQPEEIEKVKQHPLWQECLKIKGCNLAFRLTGIPDLICQSKAIQKWVAESLAIEAQTAEQGICLATGQEQPIARIHDEISFVVNKPTALCSVNSKKVKALSSYGKDQGYNFPVSEQAVFEYSTALNHLLKPGSNQKIRLGETTLVCWSKKQHTLENQLPFLLGGAARDNTDQGTEKVIEQFRSLSSGGYVEPDAKQPFYILGLAPTAKSRIAVRFWLVGTVADFTTRLGQWFTDIEMVGHQKFGYPGLFNLLLCTSLLHKSDNLPPNLGPDITRAILLGLPLPSTTIQSAIRRIRSEQGAVSYERACLIKGYLNRKFRYACIDQKELTVSLDPNDTRPGYCLGRLFAVLEKLQSDASPGLNSTIRDRYYSSASSTPKAVFGTLMRLHTHHLKKLDNRGHKVNFEKLIGEIIARITDFPAHLDLDSQGLFAIGYYHQQQNFYISKKSAKSNKDCE